MRERSALSSLRVTDAPRIPTVTVAALSPAGRPTSFVDVVSERSRGPTREGVVMLANPPALLPRETAHRAYRIERADTSLWGLVPLRRARALLFSVDASTHARELVLVAFAARYLRDEGESPLPVVYLVRADDPRASAEEQERSLRVALDEAGLGGDDAPVVPFGEEGAVLEALDALAVAPDDEDAVASLPLRARALDSFVRRGRERVHPMEVLQGVLRVGDEVDVYESARASRRTVRALLMPRDVAVRELRPGSAGAAVFEGEDEIAREALCAAKGTLRLATDLAVELVEAPGFEGLLARSRHLLVRTAIGTAAVRCRYEDGALRARCDEGIPVAPGEALPVLRPEATTARKMEDTWGFGMRGVLRVPRDPPAPMVFR